MLGDMLARTSSPPVKLATRAFLIGLGLLYCAFIYRASFTFQGTRHFTLVDDAMISMRYARHLAEGDGAVWNLGERGVQGFSNPLWMLLMSAVHAAGSPSRAAPLIVSLLGATILFVNVFVVYRLTALLVPNHPWAGLCAALPVGLYFPLVFWTLRGMELGVVVLLIDVALLIAVHPKPLTIRTNLLLGIILALLVAVRLDTAVFALPILLYRIQRQASSHRVSTAVQCASPMLVSIAFVLTAQKLYYDSFLPNTYYLKTTGVGLIERTELGVRVLMQFGFPEVAIVASAIALGIGITAGRLRSSILLLGGVLGVAVAYSIFVGGDYAEPLGILQVGGANRFIAQGMPAGIVGAVCGGFALVDRLQDGFPLRQKSNLGRFACPALTGSVCLALALSLPGWVRWTVEGAPLAKSDENRAIIGLALAATTNSDDVIAAHAIGNVAYFAERPVIDLLGKVDSFVARSRPRAAFRPGHDRWNYDHSIQTLQPNVIADTWGESKTWLTRQGRYAPTAEGVWFPRDTPILEVMKFRQFFG